MSPNGLYLATMLAALSGCSSMHQMVEDIESRICSDSGIPVESTCKSETSVQLDEEEQVEEINTGLELFYTTED